MRLARSGGVEVDERVSFPDSSEPEPLPWSQPAGDPLRALPHGPEFRFIDRLEALEPGRRATAHYRVRGDEAFLAGHFPGDPLMPGVILVEAIAQLGGVVAQSDPAQAPLAGLLLTGIRGAKILGAARPGEELLLTAEVEGRLGGMIQISGEVSVAGRVLATAKVMLSGREGEKS